MDIQPIYLRSEYNNDNLIILDSVKSVDNIPVSFSKTESNCTVNKNSDGTYKIETTSSSDPKALFSTNYNDSFSFVDRAVLQLKIKFDDSILDNGESIKVKVKAITNSGGESSENEVTHVKGDGKNTVTISVYNIVEVFNSFEIIFYRDSAHSSATRSIIVDSAYILFTPTIKWVGTDSEFDSSIAGITNSSYKLLYGSSYDYTITSSIPPSEPQGSDFINVKFDNEDNIEIKLNKAFSGIIGINFELNNPDPRDINIGCTYSSDPSTTYFITNDITTVEEKFITSETGYSYFLYFDVKNYIPSSDPISPDSIVFKSDTNTSNVEINNLKIIFYESTVNYSGTLNTNNGLGRDLTLVSTTHTGSSLLDVYTEDYKDVDPSTWTRSKLIVTNKTSDYIEWTDKTDGNTMIYYRDPSLMDLDKISGKYDSYYAFSRYGYIDDDCNIKVKYDTVWITSLKSIPDPANETVWVWKYKSGTWSWEDVGTLNLVKI